MTHIQELRDVIHDLRGGKASHLDSVPITETFNGRTVWDGVVGVFLLEGHQRQTGLMRGGTLPTIQIGPRDMLRCFTSHL